MLCEHHTSQLHEDLGPHLYPRTAALTRGLNSHLSSGISTWFEWGVEVVATPLLLVGLAVLGVLVGQAELAEERSWGALGPTDSLVASAAGAEAAAPRPPRTLYRLASF